MSDARRARNEGGSISRPRIDRSGTPAWRWGSPLPLGPVLRAYVALSAVLGLLLVLAPPADRADWTPRTGPVALTWSPPACGDATHACRDIRLRDTGVNQTPQLDPDVDYRIHLPRYWALVGGLQIRGGRNVQIRGGQIDLKTPCDGSSAACHGINIAKPSPGEVYIEGVYIRNPDPTHSRGTGDGIDVDLRPGANANDIVLQNVRIEGIAGCDPRQPASHADVLQIYRAPEANIRIDRLTGTTDCQGLQLDPDLAWTMDGATARSQTLRRVNIDVLPNPHLGRRNRYAFWFTYGGGGVQCLAAPTSLVEVWAREPDGTLAAESIWPDTDAKHRCRSVWDVRARQSSLQGVPTVTGVIRAGRPGRDFVPVGGNVGLEYKPPRSR